MIDVGATAPSFRLTDHLGRIVDSDALRGRRHILLCFYPLDFTPT
jgi:peroxiredoxin